MVAIFTGAGAGLERGSASVLGNAGLLGGASLGRNGEEVFLNAATGNLVVRQRDEFLLGLGPDSAIHRTYNSQGDLSDDNGDNWRQSTDRRVFGLTGTVNSSGSSVRRRSGDGSDLTYTWNGSAYVTSEGSGSTGTLTWSGDWVWTDGNSRITETYSAYGGHWRLVRQSDTSGHSLSYSYTGDKLTRITTADGGQTDYLWSGSKIAQITTTSHGADVTRTRYAYDSSDRLSSVTVDLTPEDHSVSDGNTYVTTYTYHGNSRLVASIGQTDGSRLDIAYDSSGRVTRLAQAVAAHDDRTTTIAYGAGYTVVTDPSGQSTRLDYSSGNGSPPLQTWAYANSTRESATIGGQPAYKYTVQADGGWAGIYDPFSATQGETLSFAVTLQAVGDSTSQTLGFYSGHDGWGANNHGSARIISGPGQLVPSDGQWIVTGLSSTQATRVEITRTFTQPQQSGFIFVFADKPMGHRSGASLLASDPRLLRSSASVQLQTANLASWTYEGLTRDGLPYALDGGQALKYTAATPGQVARVTTGLSAAPGETYSFGLTLQAVGGLTTQSLGLYGDSSGWGDNAAASARILSGPGTVVQKEGGHFYVTGLSETEVTRIEITRTYDRAESGRAAFYVDEPGGYRGNGAAVIAASPYLFRPLVESGGANQLTKITLPAAQGGAQPQTVQFTYTSRGELASVTDPAGSVTSYLYDDRGNVVRETDALGNVSMSTYDAANRLLTRTRVGSGPSGQAEQHTTRYVYDSASRLRFVVTAEGAVSEFHYDNLGMLRWEAQHTDRFYDVRSLAAGDALEEWHLIQWRGSVDKSQMKIVENRYDARGALAERITYSASDWDGHAQTGNGYRHDFFTSDLAGQILSKWTASAGTEHFVYDGLGRLRATTDVNGGTTTFVFNDAASQTVMKLSNGFVQTSTYNRAGDLVAVAKGGDFVNGGTALYKYDKLGRLRVATSASGSNAYFLYDKAGRKVADVDHQGNLIEYRYDSGDRLVATVRYANPTAGAYLAQLQDPEPGLEVGQIRPPADEEDIWSWNVYDKEGQLLQAIDGSGAVTTYDYDASGRLVRTISHSIKLGSAQIDSFKTTAPAGPVAIGAAAADKISRIFHDKTGAVVAVLDGEGYLTRSIFDGAGQLVESIAYASRVGVTLRAGGSLNDIVASLVPHPQDRSTRIVYDGQGLLRFTIDALGAVTEFRYDADSPWTATGTVRETVSYAGSIAPLPEYTVGTVKAALVSAGLASNAANRISRTVLDDAGRVAYTIDALGGVVGLSYDSQGQVIKTVRFASTLPQGHGWSKSDVDSWASGHGTASDRISRSYYSDKGELRFQVDAEGFVTRHDYDQDGRVLRTLRWSSAVSANDSWGIDQVNLAAIGDFVENSFAYDGSGRLIRSADGEGHYRDFVYRANGTLEFEIEMLGHQEEVRTRFVYDAAGRRIEEYRAWGTPEESLTRYGYDGHGNLIRIVDPNGNSTLRGYDRLGRMVEQTDAAGGVTRFVYDAFGQATVVIDASGSSTFTYYDRLGRVTHMRDAEDHVTETAYDAFGAVAAVTRRYNKALSPVDPSQAPAVAAHGLDATTRFAYDRLGRLVKTIDAEGHYEEYGLDAFGQRTHLRNKLGGVMVNSYDRRGLMVAQTRPATSSHRDGWLQALQVTDRFEYDSRGNLTRKVEAAGLPEERVTAYVYDRSDRLVETHRHPIAATDPVTFQQGPAAVRIDEVRYDARGNVVETVDPLGARTLYYYDRLNRKIGQVDALRNLTSWQYDANGNVVEERRSAERLDWAWVGDHASPLLSADDRVTQYAYDGLGRLKTQTVLGVRTGRWDGSGFRISVGDVTTSFDYDGNGRVVRSVDANGVSTHHYYDRIGRRIRTVDGENFVTGWTYDAEGNVLQERRWALRTAQAAIGALTDPAVHADDRVTDFTYDRNGRRLSETRRNVDALHVDSNGNLQRISWDATVSYAYNGLGQVTRKTEATAAAQPWDQHSVEYQYDSTGRMTQELRSWYVNQDGNWVRPVADYAYDGLDNLVWSRQSGTGAWQGERVTRYAYQGGLMGVMWDSNGAMTHYRHDAAGNLIAQFYDRIEADGATRTEGVLYERDLLGRVTGQALASYEGQWRKSDHQQIGYNSFGDIAWRGLNGGDQERFGYDKAGRLERSNSGDGVWRYYLYDGAGNQTLAIENEGDSNLVDRTVDDALLQAGANSQSGVGGAYVDGLNVSINVYDRRNQAIETRLPHRQLAGITVQSLGTGRSYNAFGEVVAERDARGNVTRHGYNSMGRTLWIERPAVAVRKEDGSQETVNPIERFAYDLSGRLIASWDANGNRTTRALLNGTGYGGSEALVTHEYHADGGIARNGYDVFGDLRIKTDEIGRARRLDYDAMGRLVRDEGPNGLYETFAYDILGQRIRHFSSYHGHSATTAYDVQGRVTRQVDFGGDTTTTTYSWKGSLHTAGMGTYGGWEKTTTYENERSLIERSDIFERLVYKRDLGGHAFTFSYDQAGRLVQQAGSETVNYTYFNTGLASSIYTFSGSYGSHNWQRKTTSFGYDAGANLTSERTVEEGEERYEYSPHAGAPQYFDRQWSIVSQNAESEYDALGRRTHWRELGTDISPDARVWYDYDANGNVRRTYAEHRKLNQYGVVVSSVEVQQNWYRYDSMNRVVTARGKLSNGQIVRGDSGVDYAYDQAGQRVQSTRTVRKTAMVDNRDYPRSGDPTIAVPYSAEVREQYGYDASGAVSWVRIAESGYVDNGNGGVTVTAPPATGALKARYTNDLLGRVTRQIDYLHNGDTTDSVAYDRTVVYNAKGQVGSEEVVTRQGSDTLLSRITNEYGSGTAYALGSVTRNYSQNFKNGAQAARDTLITTDYDWYDGAVQRTVTNQEVWPMGLIGSTLTSYYYYNGSGNLISAQVSDGRSRTITYTSNAMGQVIRRDESDSSESGDPHEVWYRFGGKQMGYIGNNGTLETDYQTSIDNRGRQSGSGAFRFGATVGSSFADFDLSLAPINSFSQGGAGGVHIVSAGETLETIALALWGDSSLWYRLAETNGLGASTALSEGQRLTIPAGVMKNRHNASTLRPYDPSEMIGDTNPATPRPGLTSGRCGLVGQIILVAVAIAVSIATAGTLAPLAASSTLAAIGVSAGASVMGSVVSQIVGVATGIQEEFSWKDVGMAALSGAVSGLVQGLGSAGKGFFADPKIAGSRVLGRAVVRAGSNAVTQGLGTLTRLQEKFSWAGVAGAAVGGALSQAIGTPNPSGSDDPIGRIGRDVLASTADAMANAAMRSLEDGSSFGDNLIAALPDVIGGTLGNLAGERIVVLMDVDENEAKIQPRPDPELIGVKSLRDLEQVHQRLLDGPVPESAVIREYQARQAQDERVGEIGTIAGDAAQSSASSAGIAPAPPTAATDPDPYTQALKEVIATKQQNLGRFDVEWSLIDLNEGALKTKGYVPIGNDGAVLGDSGVTISTGFDLGKHSPDEIRALGLPDALEDKLIPYAAIRYLKETKKGTEVRYKSRSKELALEALKANPLSITLLEAQAIAYAVKSAKATEIERHYNRFSRVPLTSLPREAQTVLVDFGFQNGPYYGTTRILPTDKPRTKELKLRKHQVWAEFTTQNWSGAKQSLEGLSRFEGYGLRRGRQIERLDRLIGKR